MKVPVEPLTCSELMPYSALEAAAAVAAKDVGSACEEVRVDTVDDSTRDANEIIDEDVVKSGVVDVEKVERGAKLVAMTGIGTGVEVVLETCGTCENDTS